MNGGLWGSIADVNLLFNTLPWLRMSMFKISNAILKLLKIIFKLMREEVKQQPAASERLGCALTSLRSYITKQSCERLAVKRVIPDRESKLGTRLILAYFSYVIKRSNVTQSLTFSVLNQPTLGSSRAAGSSVPLPFPLAICKQRYHILHE